MVERIIYRDGDRHRVQTGYLDMDAELTNSRTKQEFKMECDINEVIRRWTKTGILPPPRELLKNTATSLKSTTINPRSITSKKPIRLSRNFPLICDRASTTHRRSFWSSSKTTPTAPRPWSWVSSQRQVNLRPQLQHPLNLRGNPLFRRRHLSREGNRPVLSLDANWSN